VYGKNTSDALDELSDRVIGVPQKSRWSYSDSKAIEEAFAFAYQREMNLEFKAVRLFNTVGPGQSGDYGMVLPRLISSALSGNDLVVYGSGEQTRCFMHVDDAINGILMMLDSDIAINQIYNLGHPREISIIDLARKVIASSKSKSKIRLAKFEDVYGPVFEDMERRVPNIEKVQRDLGWRPQIDIDEIIMQSIAFQREVKASEG
jgi:UDP-glucose 4-epimerase